MSSTESVGTDETGIGRTEGGDKYWKENIQLVGWLLVVWFTVSFLFGILLAPALNKIHILGGYPLGFWFAQQGSIYTFVVLIFIYAWRMGQLDKKFGVEED